MHVVARSFPTWLILQNWPHVTSICFQMWKANWKVSNSLATKNWRQLHKTGWISKKETHIWKSPSSCMISMKNVLLLHLWCLCWKKQVCLPAGKCTELKTFGIDWLHLACCTYQHFKQRCWVKKWWHVITLLEWSLTAVKGKILKFCSFIQIDCFYCTL